MDVTLRLMTVEDKPLLIRLMELYRYETSALTDDDINEHGCYGYAHIDDYWNEAGRFPYLIRVNGKIAGFALICPHCDYRTEPDARSMGEFFVMLKYRRRGIGMGVAAQLLDRHPGLWEICYLRNNLPASLFWKRVVEKYTGGHYQICGTEDSVKIGYIFES